MKTTPYDEDETMARMCSNNTPRSMSVAVMTGLFAVGKYGKSLGDCFWDSAASRTSKQKKVNSRDARGRVSIGFTHAVGKQAVAMVNKLGLYTVLGFTGPITRSWWDYELDTSRGWRKYGVDLCRAFRAIAAGETAEAQEAAIIQAGCYEALDDAWRLIQLSGSPQAHTLECVTTLSRALNSFGKYAYEEKYPLLFDMLQDPDPTKSTGDWYAAKSDGKERRVEMIRLVVKPFGTSITELGEFAVPGEYRAVSTLRDAQQKLKDLGHYTKGIDGDFGPGSEGALFDWCEAEGHDFDELYNAGQYLVPHARELLSEA